MRRGFTLIELLVVITVIAILAGLLIPLISIALQKAREAKCQAKIANISAAINKYRDANGAVPEACNPVTLTTTNLPVQVDYGDIFLDGSSTSHTPFQTRSRPLPDPKLTVELSEPLWEAAATALAAQLGTVDRDNFRSLDDLRDPFGAGIKSKVFRYRPARFYPGTNAIPTASMAVAQYVDSDDPPNPDTFQLWSAGANGKDEYGSGDDLPNWKKKK